MPLRLSLRELEVFAAVAACESVTRAAAEVALSQSAASQALAQLEQALGVPLFDRIGRGLQLNEHGRALLPRARALLDEAAALGLNDLTLDEALHVVDFVLVMSVNPGWGGQSFLPRALDRIAATGVAMETP